MRHCDVPVEELIDFVCGAARGRHLAVLWNGMIDDSADRDRQKVVISAALIGNRDQWQTLRGAWRRRLDQDGIKYFRSSECRHLRGQFFKYNDLTKFPKPSGRETADRLRDDLDRIIHSCALKGVAAVIPVPLWKQFQADPTYASVCSRDPYHWALQTVWMQCATAMEELGPGNVIAFAHDECQSFSTLFQLYLAYKKKNVTARRLFAGLSALDDEANPPIQAADVAASVTHLYSVRRLDDPSDVTLQCLSESMYRISVWDDRFARLVLGNELSKRRRAGR